jgi:CRISPR-associated endoribonuclease Cas6
VTFDFFPLRFEFVAGESLFFPPSKAANILRGALGVIFRRIACVPQCVDVKTCDIRNSCPYAKIFEPTMAHRAIGEGPSPSGLSEWPRPFVFRARHLDGRTVAAGDKFWFDLHVFSLDRDIIAYFILTFAALTREGLGPGRGQADLVRVCTIPLAGAPTQSVYEHSQQMIAGNLIPASIGLGPRCCAPSRIRVDFLSPTELKHDHKIASRPEFPILFGRLRDRISTLRSLYGPGPLDIDFQESTAHASTVHMVRCEMRRQEAERRSTRTGQAHSIGGFVGIAEYEGDLAQFLPYLEAGRWTGVGRQVVWGKGEIAVHPA